MPGRAPVFRRPPGHLSSKTAKYPLVLFTLYPLTNDTRTIQGGTRSFAPCCVSEAVPGQETAKSLYVYPPAESECIYYPKDKTFPLWRQDADPRQMRCVIAPAHPEDQGRRLFYNQVGCALIDYKIASDHVKYGNIFECPYKAEIRTRSDVFSLPASLPCL